ncbi:MAG: hypothetical protein H6634_10940 [Anaerolineales bacterium]|nr:hypothetical protein [Anaerolineales bacterium]
MDFAKLLKSVEDAVYEVMVWLLLLPKTLIRVTFRPKWAMKYIDEEWLKKPDERFDEYLSPVMLWLLSAVFPLTTIFILAGPDIASTDDFLKALSSQIYQVTFYMMLIPFIYIVGIEWLNKDPIKRSSLKISFYRHCYVLAPAQVLTYLFFPITTLFLPLLVLNLAIIPIYEAFVFQSELKIGFFRAFLYTSIPQIVLSGLFFWFFEIVLT